MVKKRTTFSERSLKERNTKNSEELNSWMRSRTKGSRRLAGFEAANFAAGVNQTSQKRIALIGGQCGDEGKGKIAVYYARSAVKKSISTPENLKVVVQRWQGGANAGHTVSLDGEIYKLHQLPCGILIPGTFNLIGQGCFVNPRIVINEIKELRERGIKIDERNLGIASNAHVTLSHHVSDDAAYFNKKDWTSTGNGIKQTAVDKYDRRGIRFEEFLDKDVFTKLMKERFEEFDDYDEEREFLKEFSVLENDVLHDEKFEYWIGEGAQGVHLDVDAGLYPGVTSTNPSLVPLRTNVNVGVFKLYASNVGKKAFISRMTFELESKLRDEFGERGTTTGRDRDLGWFDIVAAKYSIEKADMDFIVLTCGDRLEKLDEMNEKVKLVVGYEIDGRKFKKWDKSFHNREILKRARPIFEEFEPWKEFVVNGELNEKASKYVSRISELLGRDVVLLGIGPRENDVVEIANVIV